MNWEVEIDIHTNMYETDVCGNLLYSTQSSAWCSVAPRGRMKRWREVQEEGDICTPITGSVCCTAEILTHNIVKQLYPNK